MAKSGMVTTMPFMAIDGLRMHYLQEGNWQSDQDTLLLIHGLGSSSRDWESQIAALVKHCKVLVVDLRGHGQTDKPNMPYNISLFTEDLARLLDQLKLTNWHGVG
ncbi:MAG: alpha/beta fold hydrolase, partial [Candidatus Berkiella sp.]